MLNVHPLDAPLAARITGLDLSRALATDEREVLHAALLRYQVLIFPEQHLDDETHAAFARHWGKLQVHVLNQYHHAGRPEILVITNLDESGKPKGEHPDPGAAIWHTDGSWSAERGLVTMLHALRIPKSGGDTLYANLYAAYDDLSAADKAELEDAVAVHDLNYSRSQTTARQQMTEEQQRAAPPVEWPVVRTHPETGRKCLYLGQHASHIKGMALEQGRGLLQRLNAHATQPRYVYRHVWKLHEFVMWDNRALLHSATEFDWMNDVRILRRTTTVGERIGRTPLCRT